MPLVTAVWHAYLAELVRSEVEKGLFGNTCLAPSAKSAAEYGQVGMPVWLKWKTLRLNTPVWHAYLDEMVNIAAEYGYLAFLFWSSWKTLLLNTAVWHVSLRVLINRAA